MFSPGQVSIYEIENIKSRRGNKILVCSEEKGAHSSEIVKGLCFGGKLKVAQINNNKNYYRESWISCPRQFAKDEFSGEVNQ